MSRDDEYDVVIEELNKFDAKNRKGEKGMKLPSLFDAARAEGEARGEARGRAEGRTEERAAIRQRLIAELGMSPEEADKFVNPVLAGAN